MGSYTDTGLINGQTYWYSVTALNASGESPASTQVSATPLATVLNASAAFRGAPRLRAAPTVLASARLATRARLSGTGAVVLMARANFTGRAKITATGVIARTGQASFKARARLGAGATVVVPASAAFKTTARIGVFGPIVIRRALANFYVNARLSAAHTGITTASAKFIVQARFPAAAIAPSRYFTSAHINFAPQTSATPVGYVNDYGSAYSVGAGYGWEVGPGASGWGLDPWGSSWGSGTIPVAASFKVRAGLLATASQINFASARLTTRARLLASATLSASGAFKTRTRLVAGATVGAFILDRLTEAPYSAYSLRRLRSGYSGVPIQVRRSTDNATADIGFDASGNLDTAALAAFGATLSISRWYDQSGHGADMTATAPANEWRIRNAGVTDIAGSRNRPAPTAPDNGRGYQGAPHHYSGPALSTVLVAMGTNGTSFESPRFLSALDFTTGDDSTGGGAVAPMRTVSAFSPFWQMSLGGSNLSRIAMTYFSLDEIVSVLDGTNATVYAASLGTGGTQVLPQPRGIDAMRYTISFDGFVEASCPGAYIAEAMFFESALSSTTRAALKADHHTYYGTA